VTCIDVDGLADSPPLACPGGIGDCTGSGFEFACRGDRVGDVCDVCPGVWNPDQLDSDDDGVGDVCEKDYDAVLGIQDLDGDGVANGADNCPTIFNADQADLGAGGGSAANGIGDACDGPQDREPFYGIVVRGGVDGTVESALGGDDVLLGGSILLEPVIVAGADGVSGTIAAPTDVQLLPAGFGQDCDPTLAGVNGDGVLDAVDNCPAMCNADQRDTDADGVGDTCDIQEDVDGDLQVNLLDNCPFVANPAGSNWMSVGAAIVSLTRLTPATITPSRRMLPASRTSSPPRADSTVPSTPPRTTMP
jgi:hypothetical protein